MQHILFTKLISHKADLPKLASYVCMYSEVINCDTRAVFPQPESPSITTRYLESNAKVIYWMTWHVCELFANTHVTHTRNTCQWTHKWHVHKVFNQLENGIPNQIHITNYLCLSICCVCSDWNIFAWKHVCHIWGVI